VELTTSDGLTIVGTFVPAQGASPAPACLLVHQLGADRSTYSDFQQALAAAGIASLAIDMRGHGESTGGAELSHRGFSQEQWEDVANDFKAGLDYLRSQNGVDPTRLGIVGASIAANLAVIFAADEISSGAANTVKALVLLSPGTRYHGIQPLPRARDLGRIPVLVVSSSHDSQSYPGSQSLSQAARNATLETFEGSAHGTDIFNTEQDAISRLVEWLSGNLRSGAPADTTPDESGTGADEDAETNGGN
jgi:dienelactone hydrolase